MPVKASANLVPMPTTLRSKTICENRMLRVIKSHGINAEPGTLILCDSFFVRGSSLHTKRPPAQLQDPSASNELGRKEFRAGRLLYAIFHLSSPDEYDDKTVYFTNDLEEKTPYPIDKPSIIAIAALAPGDLARYNSDDSSPNVYDRQCR